MVGRLCLISRFKRLNIKVWQGRSFGVELSCIYTNRQYCLRGRRLTLGLSLNLAANKLFGSFRH